MNYILLLSAYSDSIKVMNFGQIRERSVLFLIIIDLKAGLLFLFLLKLGYIQKKYLNLGDLKNLRTNNFIGIWKRTNFSARCLSALF